MTEPVLWEYRVQTVGGTFGTKDEQVEEALNELGAEGWEAVNVYLQSNSGKTTIVAKRPLSRTTRRQRTMPS